VRPRHAANAAETAVAAARRALGIGALPLLAIAATVAAPGTVALEAMFLDFENGNYASAWDLERRLANLAAAIPPNDPASQRRYWRAHCWYHKVGQDFDNKDRYAEQHIAQAEAAHDDVTVADLSLCRGYFREMVGDSTHAIAYYNAAVERARRVGRAKVVADSLSFRGDLRANLGDVASAVPDLLEAQRLYETLKLSFLGNQNLGQIANAYSLVGDFQMALKYLDAQYKAYEAQAYKFGMLTAKSQLGKTYNQMGQYEQALAAYRSALDIRSGMDDGGTAAPYWLGVGSALARLGRAGEALAPLAQARKQLTAGSSADFVELNLVEGSVLSKLGRHQEALQRFAVAESALVAGKNLRSEVQLHGARSAALAAMGREHEAYQALLAYTRGRWALDEQAQRQAVTRMRVAFDLERAEAQNAQLTALAEARAGEVGALQSSRHWQRLSLALLAVITSALLAFSVREYRRSRRLRVLALTDDLTHLANRRHILLAAQEALDEARRLKRPLALLIFDIDHFKRVNDSYGHDQGDLILKRVANASQRSLRKADRIGRIGGEEFMVVLPQADLAQAQSICERLRAQLKAESHADIDPALDVTVSIGLVLAAGDGSDVAALMKQADLALYQAKRKGRNRVEVYSPDLAGVSQPGLPG